jgi:hypothetical protein
MNPPELEPELEPALTLLDPDDPAPDVPDAPAAPAPAAPLAPDAPDAPDEPDDELDESVDEPPPLTFWPTAPLIAVTTPAPGAMSTVPSNDFNALATEACAEAMLAFAESTWLA